MIAKHQHRTYFSNHITTLVFYMICNELFKVKRVKGFACVTACNFLCGHACLSVPACMCKCI